MAGDGALPGKGGVLSVARVDLYTCDGCGETAMATPTNLPPGWKVIAGLVAAGGGHRCNRCSKTEARDWSTARNLGEWRVPRSRWNE